MADPITQWLAEANEKAEQLRLDLQAAEQHLIAACPDAKEEHRARVKRLREKQIKLDDRRSKLQAKLASDQRLQQELAARDAAGLRLLSALDWVLQPLPILRRRISDRASDSKTRATKARTFQALKPWPEFAAGVQETLQLLCASSHQFKPLISDVDSMPSIGTPELWFTAADEAEIRGALMQFLQHVNKVAARVFGSSVEYVGGGSNRSVSFTDLVVRHRDTTNTHDLSALLLAVLEVKGPWQMDMPQGVSLEQALEDDTLRERFVLALQHAYGDAVMDEAPLLILSNYGITYFLLRDINDATNKTLKVSCQVPRDGLPPLAAWLHVLRLADELWRKNAKAALPRCRVPSTPVAGYSVAGGAGSSIHSPALQLNASWLKGSMRSGSREQPDRAVKGMSIQLLLEAAAAVDGTSSASELGSAGSEETKSHSRAASKRSSSSGDGEGSIGINSFQVAAWADIASTSSTAAAVEALPVLSLDSLGFTSHCVASTSNKRLLKGEVGGEPAALKVFNLHSPSALAAFLQEALSYVHLSGLQGSSIIDLLALGRLPHTGAPVLALRWAEPASAAPLSAETFRSAAQALQSMHDAGAAHLDIRAGNLLSLGGHVVLCDLETCVTEATEEQFKADIEQLALLAPVPQVAQ